MKVFIRDVLILWAVIHLAGRFFGSTGYLLVACGAVIYLVFLQRKKLLAKTRPCPKPYQVRYNTKNDGTRDFWRIIDDQGVEHAADKIDSKARMETETLMVSGVLKGNVVIWASDFYMMNSVAYFR